MIIYVNYNVNEICKKVLQEQLDKLEINYSLISLAEIEIKESLPENKLKILSDALKSCSIEIIENKKNILVQKIKDTIAEMVYMEEPMFLKTSSYISDKLGLNYTYLANLFSSVTHTTIETFLQLQKIERAKQLLATNEYNVKEISWKLSYSSIGHFSNNFKNVTGLTPTAFLKIINKKRNIT